MVHHCSVPSCHKAGYRIQDGRKVSFHKIPSQNQLLRQRWIHAIKRDPGSISRHTKVCSLHFHEGDFFKDQFTTNRILRPNVVPSIFDITPSTTTSKPTSAPPKHCVNLEQFKADEDTSNVDELEGGTLEDILCKENNELKTEVENVKKALSEVEKTPESMTVYRAMKPRQQLQRKAIYQAQPGSEYLCHFQPYTCMYCGQYYSDFTYYVKHVIRHRAKLRRYWYSQ
ncbi:uncharacterized protein [Amphiura filiformis]